LQVRGIKSPTSLREVAPFAKGAISVAVANGSIDSCGSDSGSVSSLTDHHATVYKRRKVKGKSLHDMSDALRHRVVLALQEAGVLDKDERLTEEAVKKSELALSEDQEFKNPSVKKSLTENGSRIENWQKRKTQTVTISTGQRIQIHFYKNKITGEVNYIHRDFKIKNKVSATMKDGRKYKEGKLDNLLQMRK